MADTPAPRPQGTENAQAKFKQLSTYLEQGEVQLRRALPPHVSSEKFMRTVLTAVTHNPNLLECDLRSLLGACMQSAQLGLLPDPYLQHAHLVPFKNHKTGRMEVQFIPGYRGLIHLARKVPCKRFTATVVRQGDFFEYELGDHAHLRHRPCDEPGAITHAYAHIAYSDKVDRDGVTTLGGTDFVVLHRAEIDQIREYSASYKKDVKDKTSKSPWITREAEMAAKSAVRKLAKTIDLSQELSSAVTLDELHEAGIEQNLQPNDGIIVSSVTPASATAQRVVEQAKEKERKPVKPATPATPPPPPPVAPCGCDATKAAEGDHEPSCAVSRGKAAERLSDEDTDALLSEMFPEEGE